jgi:hypothetical protein
VNKYRLHQIATSLIACFALALTSCAAQDGPSTAARAWMQAWADRDGNQLASLTCQRAQRELQVGTMLYSAIDILGAMFLGDVHAHLSVDELTYDTVRDDGQSADVHVQGQLRSSVVLMSTASSLDEMFQLHFERDGWRVCGSRPYAGS